MDRPQLAFTPVYSIVIQYAMVLRTTLQAAFRTNQPRDWQPFIQASHAWVIGHGYSISDQTIFKPIWGAQWGFTALGDATGPDESFFIRDKYSHLTSFLQLMEPHFFLFHKPVLDVHLRHYVNSSPDNWPPDNSSPTTGPLDNLSPMHIFRQLVP